MSVTRGSVSVTRGSVSVTRGSVSVTRGSVSVTRGSVSVFRGCLYPTRDSFTTAITFLLLKQIFFVFCWTVILLKHVLGSCN